MANLLPPEAVLDSAELVGNGIYSGPGQDRFSDQLAGAFHIDPLNRTEQLSRLVDEDHYAASLTGLI
jgi:hypothetical protein